MRKDTRMVTIAVLTDIHFGPSCSTPQRRCEIADILVRRAVHRLNRLIHPDITVVLGDIVDDGASSGARERLTRIREILDTLASPYIAIPGNHDGDVEAFYRIFDRPAPIVDLCGLRFLPFIDREEPGFNASRAEADVERFRRARADYDGPIVALQHVCLAPPGLADIPYNYTNADEIVAAMAEARVELSVSGHHHAGAETVRNATTTFVNAPALCERPFHLTVLTIDGGHTSVDRHQLAMPEHLGLVDSHVHTQLAYCSDNMTVESAISLARDFGLAGLCFTEHSGQLYFPADRYWGGDCAREGIAGASPQNDRMDAYLALKQTYETGEIVFGLETDADFRGNLVLKPDDRRHFTRISGVIHRAPSLAPSARSLEALAREFMGILERLVTQNIDVLAHPYRIFRSAGYAAPERLFHPTAVLLRDHNVAVEINYHSNQPPPEFVRICLDMGLKFTFGSDAHSLYEVGEFAEHLKLFESLGAGAALSDVLLDRR